MSSIHETDIALSASIAAPFSATRIPTAELHINPWATGTKGTPIATVGTAASIATGIGLTMALQRSTVQSNAPSELIMGDSSGAWVINLADGSVVSIGVTNTTVSLVYMP